MSSSWRLRAASEITSKASSEGKESTALLLLFRGSEPSLRTPWISVGGEAASHFSGTSETLELLRKVGMPEYTGLNGDTENRLGSTIASIKIRPWSVTEKELAWFRGAETGSIVQILHF